jgi:hypothetical protein
MLLAKSLRSSSAPSGGGFASSTLSVRLPLTVAEPSLTSTLSLTLCEPTTSTGT